MSTEPSVRTPFAARRRGLSTVVSAILIVVVLAIVGVGSYAVLGGFSKASPLTCEPITAPACAQFQNLHDVTLILPFKSVQQGNSVPFTASLPAGEPTSTYTFNFGDGSKAVSTGSPTLSHSFHDIGTYLVYVTASVHGVVHDNLYRLVQVQVTSSYSATTAGNVPGIVGSIVSNSTAHAGTPQVTAAIVPGQSVTVTASYTSAPTDPAFSVVLPKIVSSGTLSGETSTNASATATATFPAPGVYNITFQGGAKSTNTTVPVDYNWTVFVGAVGAHPGVAGLTNAKDPHPGTIIAYELVPGGAFSEDPAIDYETAGAEAIFNVYQTLVAYNGTQTGPNPDDFVPQLATCVPGSPQCQRMYGGDSLLNGYNYTFVIQANSSFYDPATGNHWGVYPTDVEFSILRTLGFSDLPFPTANPGWIIGQSLLGPGNNTWDSLHGAYNNTPLNASNSMTINGTECADIHAINNPADHGCITFHVYGHNENWPYFLELVADPLGGAVVPCGWFSAPSQAAGIPFWTRGNISGSGDQPCATPGNASLGVRFGQMPLRGWDQWQQLGSGAFASYLGHVQWNMLGSGPYSVATYQIAEGYTLKANPAYGSNPDCTWTGCQPNPHTYAGTVEVTWETSAQPGEQSDIAGTADFASIPATDFSLFIQLINLGKLQAISAPTINIGFQAFDLNFNVGTSQRYTTTTINVHGDFFSYLGMREFFARAYPYTTIENTINTKDGIQLGFNYGGAIPQFMANYYPTNIPWPNSDPCTTVSNPACPSYWWAQMQNPTGQYYDPQIAACTSSNPCQLPLFGTTGNPTGDEINSLWTSEISSLSNGAIKATAVDVDFVSIIQGAQGSAPGLNPFPLFGLGWAPDYPDPTDYVVPLYSSNATYTYGDSVEESLYTPAFTTGCAQPYTDYSYWANATISQACQGIAYKAMLKAMSVAAVTPTGPLRVQLYDEVEKIAYALSLYVYTTQGNFVDGVAPWLNPSSVNTNVTVGTEDNLFYTLTGNNFLP